MELRVTYKETGSYVILELLGEVGGGGISNMILKQRGNKSYKNLPFVFLFGVK